MKINAKSLTAIVVGVILLIGAGIWVYLNGGIKADTIGCTWTPDYQSTVLVPVSASNGYFAISRLAPLPISKYASLDSIYLNFDGRIYQTDGWKYPKEPEYKKGFTTLNVKGTSTNSISSTWYQVDDNAVYDIYKNNPKLKDKNMAYFAYDGYIFSTSVKPDPPVITIDYSPYTLIHVDSLLSTKSGVVAACYNKKQTIIDISHDAKIIPAGKVIVYTTPTTTATPTATNANTNSITTNTNTNSTTTNTNTNSQ